MESIRYIFEEVFLVGEQRPDTFLEVLVVLESFDSCGDLLLSSFLFLELLKELSFLIDSRSVSVHMELEEEPDIVGKVGSFFYGDTN